MGLVRRSDHYHLAHDASTKGKLFHICQTVVTCVLKGSNGKGEVVTVPLKFEICPSGTAAVETQLAKDALHCDAGRGQHAALPNAKSACPDHAAPGTTDAIEVLRKEEVEKTAAAALGDAARGPSKNSEPASEMFTGSVVGLKTQKGSFTRLQPTPIALVKTPLSGHGLASSRAS